MYLRMTYLRMTSSPVNVSSSESEGGEEHKILQKVVEVSWFGCCLFWLLIGCLVAWLINWVD